MMRNGSNDLKETGIFCCNFIGKGITQKEKVSGKSELKNSNLNHFFETISVSKKMKLCFGKRGVRKVGAKFSKQEGPNFISSEIIFFKNYLFETHFRFNSVF